MNNLTFKVKNVFELVLHCSTRQVPIAQVQPGKDLEMKKGRLRRKYLLDFD